MAGQIAVVSNEVTKVPKKRSGLVTFDQIIPTGERYIVRARIVRLWKAWKKTAGSSIEMVLVDEKGIRIHASVEDKLIKKFEPDLTQGGSVSINTFDIQSNGQEYKTSPMTIKLNFFKTTKVKRYDDFPSQVVENYFQEFATIKAGLTDPSILFDVIGQVVNVGPLEESNKNGKTSFRVTIDLRDYLETQLKCTLFDAYAKEMIAYTDSHSNPPPVCVLRFVCAKEYKDVWSITNSYNATQLEFDQPTEHVEKFRLMLPKDNQIVTHHSASIVSFGNKESVEDVFLGYKYTRATVFEILTSENVGVCVTSAKVIGIGDSNKWYYLACKCNKKVSPYPEDSDDIGKKPLFYCSKCGDVEYVVPRYLLILNVSDYTGSEAKFLLFDGLAEKLLDKPAAQLVEEVEEDDPEVLPEAITQLVGNTFLFKITIDEKNLKGYNAAYRVDQYSDSEDMIQNFDDSEVNASSKKPLLLTNETSKSDGSPPRWFAQPDANSSDSPVKSFTTPTSRSRGMSSTDSTVDEQNSVTKKIKVEGKGKGSRNT